ncbi:hypothetical protein V8C42DRAFT_318200 [Trichoderma barbatum]
MFLPIVLLFLASSLPGSFSYWHIRIYLPIESKHQLLLHLLPGLRTRDSGSFLGRLVPLVSVLSRLIAWCMYGTCTVNTCRYGTLSPWKMLQVTLIKLTAGLLHQLVRGTCTCAPWSTWTSIYIHGTQATH